MTKSLEALIAKIKTQTESFDTVVLKEDEAKALIAALEQKDKRIAELEGLCVKPDSAMRGVEPLCVKLPEDFPDDEELLIEIGFLDDTAVDIKTAQWLKELRRRRAAVGIVEGGE